MTIAAQASWGGPDAATGAITSFVTGHPGHASHASYARSTGAASNGVATQGPTQTAQHGPLQEYKRQTVTGSGGGAEGPGSTTARDRTRGECGSECCQEASASLEDGHACAHRNQTLPEIDGIADLKVAIRTFSA